MLKVWVTRGSGVLMILTGIIQVVADFSGVDVSGLGTGQVTGWGLIVTGLAVFGVGGRLAQIVEGFSALTKKK